MQIEILARPAASAARLSLQTGESVTCEVGAMIAMTPDLQVRTSSRQAGGGGVLKGLRRMFAGERFFLNEFTASRDHQQLLIGPGLPGDIVAHRVTAGALIAQASSWLGSGTGIDIDASFQGLSNALFSNEAAFWLKCSGRGDVLLSSFGAIYEIDVEDTHVVDTGHIVAFEDTLDFGVGKASQTWLGSYLGGEGLVCRFHGRGKVYCQSHHPPNFGRLIGPMLRPR